MKAFVILKRLIILHRLLRNAYAELLRDWKKLIDIENWYPTQDVCLPMNKGRGTICVNLLNTMFAYIIQFDTIFSIFRLMYHSKKCLCLKIIWIKIHNTVPKNTSKYLEIQKCILESLL